MALFTTAQKREVIQTQYPTASNVAVSGNVFFAAFPDAEPIIGWLHSPRETLWIQAAVPVSACTALRTVPPLWFIDAARPYMQGDERKKWYLYALIAAQPVFQAGKTVDREIMIDETNPLYKGNRRVLLLPDLRQREGVPRQARRQQDGQNHQEGRPSLRAHRRACTHRLPSGFR